MSPSTDALTPRVGAAVRGNFSPRKFSMSSGSSFAWTFIGKWAATTFIFASKPCTTPPTRFPTCRSQVWSSAFAFLRLGGIFNVRTKPSFVTAKSIASVGNGRTTVPRGPFAVIVRSPVFRVAPFTRGTMTRLRSASSVDIREQLPPDLEFAGLGVAHDALVRRQEKETEVLRRQEAGLVAFDLPAAHREPGLDDPARIDAPGERDVVAPTASSGYERELLDVLVLAEDPQYLADEVRRRGEKDVSLALLVGVADR